MVLTGGGDSPLSIHAGPSLLLVGHFFRGEGGVGLALSSRELEAAVCQVSTQNPAGCANLG